MRHSLWPVVSRQPLRTTCPLGLIMRTSSSVNNTEYLASHIGPMPTRFSWNPLMTWPDRGKSEGTSVSAKSQDADDRIGGPAAAPTVIVGATGLIFVMGAVGVKKILLAPESISAVVRLSRRRNLRAEYLRRNLSQGEDRCSIASEEGEGGKVGGGAGLQLEGKINVVVELKLTRLLHLTLSRLPGDPPRHNPVTHPRGRLSLLLSNSKQSLGACTTIFLQWGQSFLGPAGV